MGGGGAFLGWEGRTPPGRKERGGGWPAGSDLLARSRSSSWFLQGVIAFSSASVKDWLFFSWMGGKVGREEVGSEESGREEGGREERGREEGGRKRESSDSVLVWEDGGEEGRWGGRRNSWQWPKEKAEP